MITGEAGLVSYLIRVVLALVVMGAAAGLFVAWGRRKGWVRQGQAHIKILASLPLGKDVFFVLQCGPDVFALTSGHAGTCLIGRWKYEDWIRWEEKKALPES